MMLYPAMGELSAQIHNRYMLVNVVARRARQIAEAYENAHQILNDKPVTIAINEVADGLLEDPEELHEAETEIQPETPIDTETEESAEDVQADAEIDSQAVETDAATESEAAEPDAE